MSLTGTTVYNLIDILQNIQFIQFKFAATCTHILVMKVWMIFCVKYKPRNVMIERSRFDISKDPDL